MIKLWMPVLLLIVLPELAEARLFRRLARRPLIVRTASSCPNGQCQLPAPNK